ncbi:MAG TPA: aspartyl protease family protein [Allosphingosinicella sp.]|jgi:predicted aspartyl protease
MVRAVFAGLALALSAATPGGAAPATQAQGPPAPEDGSEPFKLASGPAIYLSGRINDHPVEMLLDSGATGTVVDKKFADRIGLKPTGTIRVAGVAGAIQGGAASGVTISVGTFVLAHQDVTIADLAPLSALMNRPLDMILGRNAFEAAVVDIDFPAGRIAFREPSTYQPPQHAVAVKLTDASDGFFYVPVSIEGKRPVKAELDLGQEMSLSISRTYSDKQKLLKGRRTSTMLIAGVGGTSIWNVLRVRSLAIGGVAFHDLPAYVSHGGELPRKEASVGLDVWTRFHLVVDLHAGKLWLVPEANATSMAFAHDRLGLGMVRDGDSFKVANVAVDSPAAAAGWKTGDVVTAINGRRIDASYFDGDAHRDWGEDPAGTRISFTMADGSVRTLTLADYF